MSSRRWRRGRAFARALVREYISPRRVWAHSEPTIHIQLIHPGPPAWSHSCQPARSTCGRSLYIRCKRDRNLDTSTRASRYRSRSDQRRYIRARRPRHRKQRSSRCRHHRTRGKRPCSPRHNLSAGTEAPRATRRRECLGPKSPHQSYEHVAGADSDVPYRRLRGLHLPSFQWCL